MTHEKESDGSELDTTLPDAGTIPTFGTAEGSDLPALDDDLAD
jgi:hypothetical protein